MAILPSTRAGEFSTPGVPMPTGDAPKLQIPPSSIRSLYVHFPFCESKCHYCDFYSLGRERTRAGDADRFEAALKAEATLLAPALAPELETIFFGGGTPSMTPPDSMARALEPLWQSTRVTPETEWT